MKRIFYISKYAKNKEQGGPSRQFLFAYYFNLKGYKTILISSSSGGRNQIDFKGNRIERRFGDLTHIILKGLKIKLGFSIKRILSWFEFEYRLLKELRSHKLNENDVVIVSSLSILTFYSGLILKRKKNVILVVEVRDIWPQTLIEMSNNKIIPLLSYPLSWLEKAAYRNSDLIIGTMPNLKGHIKKILKNIPESKIVNIPMGFDKNITFKGNVSKEDKFIVGYAGSIGLANNVGLIVETARLLKDHKNIEFRLLGSGELKDELINTSNRLGLKNIIFLDAVSKDKVYSFLVNCDILVNPWNDLKIYEYGVSPNKWIDYMYAAKPIIVPYNGYRSIIDAAGCGEFIDTNDPKLFSETILRYSTKSSEELNEIGKRGKDYLLKNLNYDILSDKYLEAIIKSRSD